MSWSQETARGLWSSNTEAGLHPLDVGYQTDSASTPLVVISIDGEGSWRPCIMQNGFP